MGSFIKFQWMWTFILLMQIPVLIYFSRKFTISIFTSHAANKTGLQIEVTPLKILVWGPNDVGSWLAVPGEGVGGLHCPCNFTRDRSQVDTADAVVYAAIKSEGKFSQLPPSNMRNCTNPQLRIFLTLESPQRMYGNQFKHLPNNDQFNWTMTYRTDSDVQYLYYGRTLKNYDSNLTDVDIQSMKNHTLSIPKEKLRPFTSLYLPLTKTKLVAWVVSNCNPVSRRGDLAGELGKFVPISIFGKCGNYTCPFYCKQFLGHRYKFYLAFENSLCHDYITEKFFQALDNNLVPIVYGGADYNRLAPPGSYIDARSFGSVKKFAEYLNYLDKNPTEYLKYFLWKEHYTTGGSEGFCDLCWKMMAHVKVQSRKFILDSNYSKSYKNISAWWQFLPGQSESACQTPPTKFV